MLPGDSIRYAVVPSDEQATWAGCDDPRGVLVLGRIYRLKQVDIHSFHTKLKLTGVAGRFNSVLFCDAEVAERLPEGETEEVQMQGENDVKIAKLKLLDEILGNKYTLEQIEDLRRNVAEDVASEPVQAGVEALRLLRDTQSWSGRGVWERVPGETMQDIRNFIAKLEKQS